MAIIDSKVLDRLINQLNTSPTAKADQPLWQVIIQLIKRLKELENAINGSSGGGGSSSVTNITEQTFIIQSENNESLEPSILMIENNATPGVTEDYVVLSDGVVATPTPINDGAGNFIYVAYTP